MRTRFNTLIAAVVVVALVIGALALTGCGSKKTNLVGEWTIQDSPMVLVFTETDVKFPGDQVIPYTVDEKAQTLTLSPEGSAPSTAPFTLSKDGKTLTTIETIDGKEVKSVLIRISENGDAEPRVDNTGASTEETTTK